MSSGLEFLENRAFEWATSIVVFVAGAVYLRYKAKQQLKSGEFFDRLNVSLNIMTDRGLKLRTISERPLAEIVGNEAARELMVRVARAAKKNHDPVLTFEKKDADYILRCVVNHAAEHFSTGSLRQDCGQPVSSTWYRICLSSERSDSDQFKIRALLVKEQHLERFPIPEELPETELVLESPDHAERIHLLRRASKLYNNGEHPHLFGRMEICL